MLRATSIAVGTFLALCGVLLFRVDRVVLTRGDEPASGIVQLVSTPTPDGGREVDPAAWLPYSLVSTGLVMILYAFALPRQGT